MNLSGSIAPLADITNLVGYAANAGATFANNAAFFSTDITMPALTTRMTITICTGTGSVFNAKCTNRANTNMTLNSGTALTANAVYTFVFGARAGETWNFSLSTGGTVTQFTLEANYGGI